MDYQRPSFKDHFFKKERDAIVCGPDPSMHVAFSEMPVDRINSSLVFILIPKTVSMCLIASNY